MNFSLTSSDMSCGHLYGTEDDSGLVGRTLGVLTCLQHQTDIDAVKYLSLKLKDTRVPPSLLRAPTFPLSWNHRVCSTTYFSHPREAPSEAVSGHLEWAREGSCV